MNYINNNKKRLLVHPLWTHVPALAVFAVFLVFLFTSLPLPGWVPVHFGFDGEPNRYGSPWEFSSIIIVLSVFFLGLSVFLDELWARQEKKKSFNWLCWLDDLTVGWMGSTGIDYLLYLRSGEIGYTLHWGFLLAVTGGAVLLGVLLEFLRPYRPYTWRKTAREPELSTTELARQIKEDTNFVYWDIQNPAWVTLLSVMVPLIFLGSAVLVWFSAGGTVFTFIYLPFAVLIATTIIAFAYGGQRTFVTRQEVTIRWGLAGFRVLRLKTEDITGLSLHEYAALKDFGGYGIRFNTKMTAYILGGHLGVKITAALGRTYLIGSGEPERLLEVLQLVAGKK